MELAPVGIEPAIETFKSFCSCLCVSSEWTDMQANNLGVWAGPTGLAGRARWRGRRAAAGVSACCQSRGQRCSLGWKDSLIQTFKSFCSFLLSQVKKSPLQSKLIAHLISSKNGHSLKQGTVQL